MRRHTRPLTLIAIAAALLLGGCDADSPSEPRQPPQPPVPPITGATFNVTVAVSPGSLIAGSTTPATVTVTVRRADNGQPPPDGSDVTLTTTLGSLGSLGGPGQATLTLVNGSAQTVLFAGNTVGIASLRAVFRNDVGIANVEIREQATFFISHVEPNSGSPQGGDQVTIFGGGFEEPVRVTFDGNPAQIQQTRGDRIVVVTPPSTNPDLNAVDPANVVVTINLNEVNQATDTLVNGFTYRPGGGGPSQPQVLSVTPTTGPNEGGTVVTINGDGFETPLQVLFEVQGTGVEAVVQSVSRSQIVAVTPSATGFGTVLRDRQVDIRVKNLDSGLSGILGGAFRYGVAEVFISSLSPVSGPPEGNTLVTLTGQGFDDPVQVLFIEGNLNLEAQVISVSGTQVVIRTPAIPVTGCGAETRNFTVRLRNLQDPDSPTAQAPVPFRYDVPDRNPQISGLNPTSGGQGGNTLVTISGQGFDPPVRVDLLREGAVFTATVQGNPSSTAIQIRTPAVPNSFFEEEACGNGGLRYIPTSADVQVTNTETGCTDTFGNGFRYTPSDQTCRGEQLPPQCSDGIDNDGDTDVDFPADAECSSPFDDDESA